MNTLKNNEREILYCIHHEKMVDIEPDTEEMFHMQLVGRDDYYLCDGPFTSCPPPVLSESDWDFIFSMEENIK